MPVDVKAQQSQVRGTVVDEKGAPVPRATVQVKGKDIATATDESGAFVIAAKTNDVLSVSAVSFATVEIKVTDAGSYNVTLTASATALLDVVVVGYGRGSKKTLSSAITSVKPEDLNRAVTGDVGQLLQGKVPGLNITASGDPNAAAAVVLRGASTINSPQGPFYVIDGIPGADIATIAPADIASVDVLKDAAATAIYGNKASNGVIIVTTKKGRAGRTQASYDGYVGLEKVSGSLEVMNADQIKAYVSENGNTILPTDDLGANTDWMKAIQRSQAVSQNHNISFSGGNKKSTYSASLNYLNKEGILLSSELSRIIARLSLEQKALKGVYVSAESKEKIQNIVFDNVDVSIEKTTAIPGGIYDRRPAKAAGFVKGKTAGFYFDTAGNILLRNCSVRWGINKPLYFGEALFLKNIEGFIQSGFTGKPAGNR
ncbi:MAG: TonB-dependent receptor plug domain-containing protein [Niabella sp.]